MKIICLAIPGVEVVVEALKEVKQPPRAFAQFFASKLGDYAYLI